MSTNEFLPFCSTDTGTNLVAESDYLVATDRISGNKPGVASSQLVNRALRQSNFITSQFAQFISNQLGSDVLDNAVNNQLLGQIMATFQPIVPIYTKYTTGTGTHYLTYVFFINTGNATVGATYTHNTVTYTVVATVASSSTVLMTGSAAPLATGTLTKATGTGDATLTFFAYRAPRFLNVKLVGGGGGGAGSGASGGGTGGTGGTTTFGTSLLSASGGVGGSPGGAPTGGVGGTGSITAPAVGSVSAGAYGNADAPTTVTSSSLLCVGGSGGASPYGGAGCASISNTVGDSAQANSGSGGGGASSSSNGVYSGSGGGSGAFISALITSPSSIGSFPWGVGAAGSSGSGGTGGGYSGGVGGAGLIEILAQY
jgi:hypothetical protein